MASDVTEQKKQDLSDSKVINTIESMDLERRNTIVMLDQIIAAEGSGHTTKDKIQIAAYNMGLMGAQDHIERMLTVQMIGIHNTTMNTLARANQLLNASDAKLIELGNLTMNTANKLTRAYTNQIEALNRYRGKNQQKMTVEHVNVNAGGQAIIGNVKANEKPATKGVDKNSK